MANYDVEYDKIVEICPSLKSFIEYIKHIPPIQKNEYKKLQYDLSHYGDLYSYNRLIEIFLHVAVHIAFKQAITYDIDIEDAIGAACVGLTIAADKCWQYNNASTFCSYASKVILQNILYEQTTQRLLYYPIPKKVEYRKIYPDLKRNGCIGCNELLKCKMAKEIIIDKLKCDEKKASVVLSMMISDEKYGTITDILEKENQENDIVDNFFISFLNNIEDFDSGYEKLYHRETTQMINGLLNQLTPREAKVIQMRYGFNYEDEKTLEQISREFNLTRERIRQIHKEALYKLRSSTNIKSLAELYYGKILEIIKEKPLDLIDELIKNNGFIKIKEENEKGDCSEFLFSESYNEQLNNTINEIQNGLHNSITSSNKKHRIKKPTRNNWKNRKQRFNNESIIFHKS